MKDFKDVQIGDKGLDYNGESVTIVDKGTARELTMRTYVYDTVLVYSAQDYLLDCADEEEAPQEEGVIALIGKELAYYSYGDHGVHVPDSKPAFTVWTVTDVQLQFLTEMIAKLFLEDQPGTWTVSSIIETPSHDWIITMAEPDLGETVFEMEGPVPFKDAIFYKSCTDDTEGDAFLGIEIYNIDKN